MEQASDIDWPWEYKTECERFPAAEFCGKQYVTRNAEIGEHLLSNVIGNCKAQGYDYYTGKQYNETFEVRKINGISESHLIAVAMGEKYYVYLLESNNMPATFGELSDAFSLPQSLKLNRFTQCEGYNEKDCFTLKDDAYIWQILSECRNAKACENASSWKLNGKRYLSFTATSDALGVYKRVFNITVDGYVHTNIFDYAYVYFIGEQAAEKIINYAENNCVQAEPEPYENTVAGTLAEIGDGYVLIDDAVLCADKNNGTVFKVMTKDIKIKRCIECMDIKVGDIVAVKFQGTVSDKHEIDSANSMSKGALVEGDLVIAECY